MQSRKPRICSLDDENDKGSTLSLSETWEALIPQPVYFLQMWLPPGMAGNTQAGLFAQTLHHHLHQKEIQVLKENMQHNVYLTVVRIKHTFGNAA